MSKYVITTNDVTIIDNKDQEKEKYLKKKSTPKTKSKKKEEK